MSSVEASSSSASAQATFADLPLDRRIFKAVAKMGFVYPTKVQSLCIPPSLEGKDMLAKAKTGSGKTAAFSIPVIQNVLTTKLSGESVGDEATSFGTLALILVPTQELVDQVYRTLKELTYFCSDQVKLFALSSNAPFSAQVSRLNEQPDVVVSTPARILKHLEKGNYTVKESLKFLVIDEADLVLSFGYEEDVKSLVEYLPKLHQTILMSATLNAEVESLKDLVLNNPIVVEIEESASSSNTLTQLYIRSSANDKFLLTYALLKLQQIKGKTLFFVNSVNMCFKLKLFLEQFHISAAVLNAELPYNSRFNILQQFNRGVFDYLIATDESVEYDEEDSSADEDDDEKDGEEGSDDDSEPEDSEEDLVDVAKRMGRSKGFHKKSRIGGRKDGKYGVARGIDFRAVNTVVNFDFPTSMKSYTHRVGRTARGGASGVALSLVSSEELGNLQAVLDHQEEEASLLPPDEQSTSNLMQMDFNMADVNGFRYRAEDVLRAVTKAAVKEARLKEIKMEMLNSEKLQAHFEDNPREYELLKHDKVLRGSKIQSHLSHVPTYLIPDSLSEEVVNAKAKKRKLRKIRKNVSFHGSKRKTNDPLKSFKFGGFKERKGGNGRKKHKH